MFEDVNINISLLHTAAAVRLDEIVELQVETALQPHINLEALSLSFSLSLALPLLLTPTTQLRRRKTV